MFQKNRSLEFKELTNKRIMNGTNFADWHGCLDGDSLTNYLEEIGCIAYRSQC